MNLFYFHGLLWQFTPLILFRYLSFYIRCIDIFFKCYWIYYLKPCSQYASIITLGSKNTFFNCLCLPREVLRGLVFEFCHRAVEGAPLGHAVGSGVWLDLQPGHRADGEALAGSGRSDTKNATLSNSILLFDLFVYFFWSWLLLTKTMDVNDDKIFCLCEISFIVDINSHANTVWSFILMILDLQFMMYVDVLNL